MGRTGKRLGAGVSVLALVIGAGACGDDDDAANAPQDEAAAVDDGAFCDELLAFAGGLVEHGAVGVGSPEADLVTAGEQLDPLARALADDAPEGFATYAGDLADAVAGLLDGDATAFSSEAVVDAYPTFLDDASDTCDFDSVPIRAVDHAFEGVPPMLPAGIVKLDLSNASLAEDHELVLLRRAEGEERPIQELLALGEGELFATGALTTKAFTAASPGQEAGTPVELEPGRYVMVCFLPIGGAADGPALPHYTQGMVAELTVE